MDTSDNVAISVIMPVYNGEDTMHVQLDALARQKLDAPWELIVADNGSTDRTVAVAAGWSDRLPVRVVDASARRGPSAARNIAVRHARAPLLAFCDADDRVADDWLEKVHTALQTDEFVAVGARYRAIHSSKSRPEYGVIALHWSTSIAGLPIVGAGHMAVTTAAFREAGGFDESLRTGEDDDLSWRLQLAGHALVEHPEAIIDIARREDLVGVFRQAYSWGAGDRQVQHKFADVIAAIDRAGEIDGLSSTSGIDAAGSRHTPSDTDGPGVVTEFAIPERSAKEQVGIGSRVGRVLRSLRSPVEFGQLIARTWSRTSITLVATAGSFLGERFGPFDPSMPRLDASLAQRYIEARRNGLI